MIAPKCVCEHSKSKHRPECIRCECKSYKAKRYRWTGKVKRFADKRNKPYTDWVAGHGCLIRNTDCWHPAEYREAGRYSDPAHVDKTRGVGAGDAGEVVNLCRHHHREQEGRTAEFNKTYGVNLKQIAQALWVEYERTELGKTI